MVSSVSISSCKVEFSYEVHVYWLKSLLNYLQTNDHPNGKKKMKSKKKGCKAAIVATEILSFQQYQVPMSPYYYDLFRRHTPHATYRELWLLFQKYMYLIGFSQLWPVSSSIYGQIFKCIIVFISFSMNWWPVIKITDHQLIEKKIYMYMYGCLFNWVLVPIWGAFQHCN